jgi:hypothetical protein
MKMKIESGYKNKKLKELEPGDLFIYQPDFYIKTDEIIDGLCECVCLESGFIELIVPEANVGIVEDAVLKIGGYYK